MGTSTTLVIDDVLGELQIDVREFELPELVDECQDMPTDGCITSSEMQCNLSIDQCQLPDEMESHHRLVPQKGKRKPRSEGNNEGIVLIFFF